MREGSGMTRGGRPRAQDSGQETPKQPHNIYVIKSRQEGGESSRVSRPDVVVVVVVVSRTKFCCADLQRRRAQYIFMVG